MLTTYIGLIRFGFSLVFGAALSVCFAGMEHTRRNRFAAGICIFILLLVQFFSWRLFGLDLTSKLYPLIIHLPMILFLTIYLKHSWLISTVSVLTAYLCCQLPRWIGSIGGAVIGSELGEHLVYIIAIFLAYYLFQVLVADTLRQLMQKSVKSCILLGAVPLFFYLFDYITTIYTDLLYTGAKGAVQFMPSVLSVLYFVFIVLHYIEEQKQAIASRERDMLSAQLHGAHMELISLRQMQSAAAAYRHDMRHHLGILQSMATEGSIERIKTYLNTAQSDIDAITPIRFCENETVNLILSSFAAKAKNAGITMTVDAKLPGSIPLSDTELCSLLSNGLENAISATVLRPDPKHRTMSVKAAVHKANLLILIENPYDGKILMKKGLPHTSVEGHGYGTRSIAAIADAHGGQAIFSASDGIFTLKVMIPLRDRPSAYL
ncbi:MAG: sensor histidine kinase [Clostridiaceae bacterium]|jgi:hypothetical protein|nr:sensor histidine kinase [Clostridiaceae bacterium]